jgi:transcription initiation factor TFIIB
VKSVRDRACEIYVKDVSVEGARGRVERKKRGGEVLRERRDSARAPRRARPFFFSTSTLDSLSPSLHVIPRLGQVSDNGKLKGRGQAAVTAAVTYIACRQEGHPRSFKEICEACPPGSVDKRDVGRAYKTLIRELDAGAVGPVAVVSASHLARRFCSRLGLAQALAKAAEEMAEAACPRDGVRPGNAAKPWDGQSPLSQAAAIILVISHLPGCPLDVRPDPPDVAGTAGVTDATMRVAARNMWPDLADLVPTWYASRADVEALMRRDIP